MAEIYIIEKKGLQLLNKDLQISMMKYFHYDHPFDDFKVGQIKKIEKKWRQFKG